MEQVRKPFQGVINIIRFNWHFYVIALGVLVVMGLLIPYLGEGLGFYVYVGMTMVMVPTLISLLVSCYVYDFTALYSLKWLDGLKGGERGVLVNIHAGFDETSVLLRGKFQGCELSVFDFYNPEKHTEVSIKRARRAYPAFPMTEVVSTDYLPMEDNSAAIIFAIFAAHEVRDEEERVAFFKEMKRILQPDGEIVITEHLRDAANFFAYNIGFMHFHSRDTWLRTFEGAGLRVKQEVKLNSFVTTFILIKDGYTT